MGIMATPEILTPRVERAQTNPASNGRQIAEVGSPGDSAIGTQLSAPLPRNMRPLPPTIIAASEEMRELTSVLRAVAPTNVTVLLVGESGTGKEVFAHLLHDMSERADGPYVTVNCGAIPEGLIESELFGHEKGSFTGAHAQRKGFFEAANNGTIFLDEIGEMPLSAQVKLLRVLETGTFTRVGSTTQLTTNARVVAATNRDLEIDVRNGTFRTDLYYRLRAVMLRIPPLRNRRDDIPYLIESILDQLIEKHKLPEMPRINPDAVQQLIEHEWRGNVRELRNVLEQLVILVCSITRQTDRCVITLHDVERALNDHSAIWQDGGFGGRVLPVPTTMGQKQKDQSERELIYRALIELRTELAELKEMVRELQHGGSAMASRLALPHAIEVHDQSSSDAMTLEEIEHKAVTDALERFGGNRRLAAESLGISERTLYRKLKGQDEE
jgi:transcriptional regulator with PAS, ATPase and Fis domain